MKVRIGNYVFDSKAVPILLILEDGDRDRILKIPEELNSIALFPDGLPHEVISAWAQSEPKVPNQLIMRALG